MLTELAEKYGTDKCPKYRHNYTEFYEWLLSDLRVARMLEVGIGHPGEMAHVPEYQTGASLLMWGEFFRHHAAIYALDHNVEAVARANELPQVKAYHVEQDRIDNWFYTLKILPRGLDFIIDDGSHNTTTQFGTAVMLVPLLRPGGVMVIEDVSEPLQLRESIPYRVEIETFDETQPDDRLAIIRR